MRKYRYDILALLVLTILPVLFFLRLLVPSQSILATPDFGRSDAWHFSFATKYALSEALKAGQLPTWRFDIGDGFPLLAEGQTGTFYLPNLLLFRFFPMPLAYTLSLITSFLLSGYGWFFYLRVVRMKTLPSLFGALVATYASFMILQLPHSTLLSAISLMPILLASTTLLFTRGILPWAPIISFLLTQQLFAGFPQAVLLTGIAVFGAALTEAFTTKRWGRLWIFCICVLIGILGSAAQVLPSYEFLKQSTSPTGFDYQTASYYSMPLVHLITFLFPFALGSPKIGTYPSFWAFDGSIFWENTLFVGWIPLLLTVYVLIRKWKYPLVRFWGVALLGALLLSLGKYSPLYLAYAIWPLTLFRVPSRFLWIDLWALTVLSTVGFASIRSKIFCWILLGIALIQLTLPFATYHLIIPFETLLQKDNPYQPEKLFVVGDSVIHNKTFLTKGWTDPTFFASLYRESYSPISTMIVHQLTHNIYAGRFLNRSSIFDALLAHMLPQDQQEATLSSSLLLDLSSVTLIHSFIPLDAPMLPPPTIATRSGITIYDYQNPTARPAAYITRNATSAATLTQAYQRLTDPSFQQTNRILLENRDYDNMIDGSPVDTASFTPVTTVTKTHTTAEYTTDDDNPGGIFVRWDTYYPGWKATVDGVETNIFPVNLKQQAVRVTKGSHRIRFTYAPQSLTDGIRISVVILLIVGGFAGIPLVQWIVSRTRKTTHRPSLHRRYNRGT